MASLLEVQELVQQLYRPATPAEIDHEQKQLQATQRVTGWTLADGLMRSDDQNVRFFAALTFTVKINQDGADLSEDDLNTLLHTLLNWLVLLVKQGEGILVLKKLCSTLVTFFLLPNSTWRKCLRHVLTCLQNDTAVPEASSDNDSITKQFLHHLSPVKRFVILTITRELAEEGGAIEHTSQHFNYCHERIELNLPDAVAIIGYAIECIQTDFNDYQTDVFQAYQSWIAYARQEYARSSQQLKSLRTLLGNVGQCLFVQDTFEAAAEFFTDLFTADDDFLNFEDATDFAQLFNTPWACAYLVQLEQSDVNDEAFIFGQLVSAFAQAIARYIIKSPVTFRNIVDHMHRLSRTQRFETIDQSLSNACIDFWENFCSQISDVAFEDEIHDVTPGPTAINGESRQLHGIARTDWLLAVEELCTASALPSGEDGELCQLGSDHAFSEFRGRVKSAVQSSYTAFKHSVLEKLVSLSLEIYARDSSRTQCWAGIEAVFNCLRGLSESMKYEATDREAEDIALQHLLNSPMYSDLTRFTELIPSRLRKEAITVIGEQDDFLGRHDAFLLSALEVLFNAVEQPGLATTASRAIFTLCNSNRAILGTRILPFMEVSERFFRSDSAKASSKKNVAAAIAAISQALLSQDDRVHIMGRLLKVIEHDYYRAMSPTTNAQVAEDYHQMARLSILEQLVAVGKASQTPEDVPIDLDAETDLYTSLWGPIQMRVASLLGTILSQSHYEGNVLATTFEVLRTGYRETQAGPFVFDPQVTVDLVVSTHRDTQRVDIAVSSASALLSSSSAQQSMVQSAVPVLLTWLYSIIDADLATRDPELSNACIEFLSRLIPRHVSHLNSLSPQAITMLFNFTLQCLNSGEVLPKRSAASLWTILLDIRSPNIPNLSDSLVDSLGSSLVTVLINNFGGNASRSQLDWLAEPYRKLIFRHARSPWRHWTEQALMSTAFPSDRVSDADKRKFLKQVEQLRGDRKTNTVVKEFWLACRGTPAGYG